MDTQVITEAGMGLGYYKALRAGDILECMSSRVPCWTQGEYYTLQRSANGQLYLVDNDGDPSWCPLYVTFRKVPEAPEEITIKSGEYFDEVEGLQEGDRLVCTFTSKPSWWTVGKEYALVCDEIDEGLIITDDQQCDWSVASHATFRKVPQDPLPTLKQTPKPLPELEVSQGQYVLCVSSRGEEGYKPGSIYRVFGTKKIRGDNGATLCGIFGTFVNLGAPVSTKGGSLYKAVTSLKEAQQYVFECVESSPSHMRGARYRAKDWNATALVLDNGFYPASAKFVLIPKEYLEETPKEEEEVLETPEEVTIDYTQARPLRDFKASAVLGDRFECMVSGEAAWWTKGKVYTTVNHPVLNVLALKDDAGYNRDLDLHPEFRKVPKDPVDTLSALHGLITLREGDLVRCVSSAYHAYEPEKVYTVDISMSNNVGVSSESGSWTGLDASWELVARAEAAEDYWASQEEPEEELEEITVKSGEDFKNVKGLTEGDRLVCISTSFHSRWSVGKEYPLMRQAKDVLCVTGDDGAQSCWAAFAEFRKVSEDLIDTSKFENLNEVPGLKKSDRLVCVSAGNENWWTEGKEYTVGSTWTGELTLMDNERYAWHAPDGVVFRKVSEGGPEEAASTDPKAAFGNAKPGLSSIPPTALFHLGRAMDTGRAKYGHMNWRENPVNTLTYVDALFRHAAVYLDGENKDPESGLHPLAHVMACCAIILDAEAQGTLVDNRPTEGTCRKTIETLTVT